MEPEGMAPGHENEEEDVGKRAFSDPVVRTYLYKHHTDSRCLALLLGVLLIIAGPLTGAILRRNIKHSVSKRQRIDNSTACFLAQEDSQRCATEIFIEITFFDIQNREEVLSGTQAPVLQEVGPYAFVAREVHANVTYPNVDRVVFTEKEMEFESSCDICDWDAVVSVGLDSAVTTDSVRNLTARLLNRREAEVTLDTGVTKNQNVFDVLEYRQEAVQGRGKYNGKAFGDAFSTKPTIAVFDSWLETTVTLLPLENNVHVHGVDAVQLQLPTDADCATSETPCADTTWSTSQENVVYSLPFVHSGYRSSLNPTASFDSSEHSWKFLVDAHFGITLSSTRTHQTNHLMTISGSDPFWLASHWRRLTAVAQDSDINFIKDTIRNKRIIFFACEISVTLCGAALAVTMSAMLCCTPAARKRLATIKMLSRSRSRDPTLNPSQFKTLGRFLQSQLRRKRDTASTDSATNRSSGTKTASQPTKEFDDVRSISLTQNNI